MLLIDVLSIDLGLFLSKLGTYLLAEEHNAIERHKLIARVLRYDRQKVRIFVCIDADVVLMDCLHTSTERDWVRERIGIVCKQTT